MKENKEFLRGIIRIPSADGDERQAAEFFTKHCTSFPGVEAVEIDHFNNAVVKKGHGDIKMMISGHIDEIGFQVQYISKNGFVNIAKVGGIDLKVLQGAQVECNGLTGIIAKRPIHVETQKERESVPKIEEILVDFGFKDDEEARQHLAVGDMITFKKGLECLDFGPSGEYIVAPALDDKLGVYVVSEVMRRVNVPEGITLYGVATTQEEVGLRGAKALAMRLNPNISIDIDVCPSTEQELNIDPKKYGEVALGKGVVIPFGPDKSRAICKTMCDICQKEDISYQRHVAVAGGTNTSAIQTSCDDCETMLLSLPNQNMHTQIEKCNWIDTEACINLMVKFIEQL